MDNDKSKKFSDKMCDILNYGSLNLAMGIGYEVGIFEALSKFDHPSSCKEIANKAEIDERYLYEWLGVMVSGGVIEISEKDEELFFLPNEHRPFLCKSGGNSNMAVYTQEIPLLTSCVKDKVVENMKTGAGISYSNYPKFYTFMEELANAKHQDVLIKIFLPSVQNGKMIEKLKEGIAVCDLGCAEGIALELMAKEYPNSKFVGIDISENSIKKATQRIKLTNLKNLEFKLLDAAKPNNYNNYFDYITAFDSIHDQTKPFEALQNIYSMLKKGGVFSMIDIAAHSKISKNTKHPMGTFLYTVSFMHCMPVGLVNKGVGLGMMWGKEKAVELCSKAGFKDIKVNAIPEDGFNFHYECIK